MIYAKLDSLARQMMDIGYAPDINFALHNVADKEKEDALFDHSEKLAVLSIQVMRRLSGS